MTPKYRPDIDGLRALAVLSVVLYHAGLSVISGGFVGVDVFFTISGYLITAIIVREISDGTFTFKGFYERRFRRILPASMAMVLASALVGVIVLEPKSLVDLGKSLLANSLFSTNLYFYSNVGGYFDGPAKLKPLLHTWSLSVEEQFYFCIPILLVLVHKLGRGSIRGWLSVLALGSLALSGLWVHSHPKAAFYLLPTRAWELLLGGLVALYPLRPIASRVLVQLMSVLGLLLIGFALFAFDDATAFPGFAALLPCLGTALLIYAGSQGPNWVSSGLALRPVVFIGLISYSLYLWHWPYLVFFKLLSITEPGALAFGLMLVAMLGTSVASYYFVETPFRKKRWLRSRAAILWASLLSCLLTAGIGWVLVQTNGLPARYGNLTAVGNEAADGEWLRWKRCDVAEATREDRKQPCTIGASSGAPRFLLVGDSHSTALASGVHASATRHGVSGSFTTYSGCPPLIGIDRANWSSCDPFKQGVIDYLKRTPSIRTVIFVGRWSYYAAGPSAHEQSAPVLLVDQRAERGAATDNASVFTTGLKRTVAALSLEQRRVVLVAGVPEIGYDVPSAAVAARLTARDLNQLLGFEVSVYKARNALVTAAFAELAAQMPALRVIQPDEALCAGGRCRVVLGDQPLYRDDDHLSTTGSLLLAPLYDPVFATLASPQPALP